MHRFAYGKSTDEIWFDSIREGDYMFPLWPFHWGLSTGIVRQTPSVPKKWSGQDFRFIEDYGSAWSSGRRLYAYWSDKIDPKWDRADPTNTQLAVSSTQAADKLSGMTIEPNPRVTTIAWTPRNTLLYSFAPRQLNRQWYRPIPTGGSRALNYNYWPKPADAPFEDTPQQELPLAIFGPPHLWPSIYEADVDAARGKQKVTATKLIANAFVPIPSPDNRFIAFIGWEQQATAPAPRPGQKAQAGAVAPRWWVWDRKAKTRTLLGDRRVFGVDAAWSGDSRTLYFNAAPGERARDSGLMVEKPSQASIFAIDIASLFDGRSPRQAEAVTRAIGEIAVQAAASKEDLQPDFRMRGLTRDGKYLLLDSLEFIRANAGKTQLQGGYDSFSTIHALRLSDGKDEIVARLKNVESYDWFDLSTPAP